MRASIVPTDSISKNSLLDAIDAHSMFSPGENLTWSLEEIGIHCFEVASTDPLYESEMGHEALQTSIDPSSSVLLGKILPGTTRNGTVDGNLVGA